DGVFAIAAAVVGTTVGMPWWALLLEGVCGIAVGVLTFAWPGITALVLLYLIAFWAVVTGVFEMVAAIRLRKEIHGEWLLALSGVLSVLFGVALVVNPAAGALAVVWLIGAYAIAFGVLLIALGFRLRNWLRRVRVSSVAVRREKVRIFSGCNSRPDNWSLHPVASGRRKTRLDLRFPWFSTEIPLEDCGHAA
ncbi:MAG: HdeD family acid-resistance protein, partial [Isosphaeraceae bacterium]